MNFDPRDLIDSNLGLLKEAAVLSEPSPAVLITVATWGRGADPGFLQALQPYRHGLGYNGSIVARVPAKLALGWLPSEEAKAQVESRLETADSVVFSAVFKDWVVEVI